MNSSSHTALKTVARLWQIVSLQTNILYALLFFQFSLNSRFSLGELGVPQLLGDVVLHDEYIKYKIAKTKLKTV